MILDELKRARAVGTPIVAITTSDQPNIVKTLQEGSAPIDDPEKKGQKKSQPPMILWDAIKGFRPLNDTSNIWIKQSIGDEEAAAQFSSLASALDYVLSKNKCLYPIGSTLVLYNAHRHFDEIQAVQALMNLRDSFKGDKKMVVLMGPDFNFPPEIGSDILVIDEPLPTPKEIDKVLTDLYSDNDVQISKEEKERAIDALRGLSPFPIEQAAALAVYKDDSSKKLRVNIEDLWDRKRSMIKQVKGLTLEKAGDTFDQLGGLTSIKTFAKRMFGGPRRPKVVCFIDEIEKMIAGAGQSSLGDSSGTSQDQLGVVLSAMEDYNFSGFVAVGPGGSGKSAIARAIASTFNVPLAKMDLGAAKGGIVGQSEAQIRALMKAVLAIAGPGGAFFIATCNKLDVLPPELRRRFRAGIWFFDLPDESERVSIGALQYKRYEGVQNDPNFWKACEGWSGANIRDCCEMAYTMQISIREAAAYIVPAEKQDKAGVDRLRSSAIDKYLSASSEGTYKGKEEIFESSVTSSKSRKIGV